MTAKLRRAAEVDARKPHGRERQVVEPGESSDDDDAVSERAFDSGVGDAELAACFPEEAAPGVGNPGVPHGEISRGFPLACNDAGIPTHQHYVLQRSAP